MDVVELSCTPLKQRWGRAPKDEASVEPPLLEDGGSANPSSLLNAESSEAISVLNSVMCESADATSLEVASGSSLLKASSESVDMASSLSLPAWRDWGMLPGYSSRNARGSFQRVHNDMVD